MHNNIDLDDINRRLRELREIDSRPDDIDSDGSGDVDDTAEASEDRVASGDRARA